MAPFSATMLHALLICIPFTVFVLVSFLWKPRVWLHNLPADIIQMAPPKSDAERRLTRYVLLPIFLLILPGLSVASVLYLAKAALINFSFTGLVIHLYGIWIIVHLWDFIVIDCVAILLINPQHPPIAGTAGAAGWSSYGFHFRSSCKAVIMSVFFVVPAAAVLYFLIR